MVAQPGRAQLLSSFRLARFQPEIAIFAGALVLRLALFLAVGAWDPARLEKRIFVGDARDYQHLAVNLAEHGVYSSSRQPPLEPNTFRVPLYSFYLSVVYRLFGPRPHLAILAQLLMGALTCVVVCRLGTRLFDRRAGIAAGAIFAFDYSAVLFSNRLYADTMFTLLIVLAVLAVARFVEADGNLGHVTAAGVVLGLATLCRPVSLFLPIVLVLVIGLVAARGGAAGPERRRWRGALAASGVLVIVYLVVLSPWMLRNFALLGRPYVTSMQAKIPAWYLPRTVDAPLSVGRTAHAVAEAARSKGPLGKLAGDARSYARGFVRYFAILGSGEYPLILGVRYRRHDAVGLREAGLSQWVSATLHNRSTPLQRAIVIAIVAYLAALYLAAARGAWVALRRGCLTAAALLIATIAYFMIATGPIAREIRYRLPALPAIVVFAGLGVTAPRGGGHNSRSSEAASRASAA
jgi:4-amino-4-deoxy-L-arabinose transferase-like glycosyltransferase